MRTFHKSGLVNTWRRFLKRRKRATGMRSSESEALRHRKQRVC